MYALLWRINGQHPTERKNKMANDILQSDYFVQRMQCPFEVKEELLEIVWTLVELAVVARDKGILAMDRLVSESDNEKYKDPFLRKAVSLVADVSDTANINSVLYNFIISSGYSSGHRFLRAVIIAETLAAISQKEDTDYIFNYLVPSLFGLEFDEYIVKAYHDYKHRLVEELNEAKVKRFPAGGTKQIKAEDPAEQSTAEAVKAEGA